MDDIAATPDQLQPVAATGDRLASLDFIRGIAVMGILAANIVAFGQPMAAYMYPDAFTVPHSDAEDWMWVAQFVAIDGKMRGLFTLLFGAGMLLFLDKAWARGATLALQVRRLLWLGLFGILHYVFVWRGDILLLYATAGLAALLFVTLERRNLLILGLLGYVGGALFYGAIYGMMHAAADMPAGETVAMTELVQSLEAEKQATLADGRLETVLLQAGRYGDWVGHNIVDHAPAIASSLFLSWFETLPLMLIGMALYRYGVFDGRAAPRDLRVWGWGLLLLGTALTVPIALWTRDAGLTYYGTQAALGGYAMLPRLPAIVGLAFLLSLWGAHASGGLAERVNAAGRAAFTNYLGTSMLMLLVFHGWAGGLFGRLGRSELYLVMFATCAVMLLWSKPWLARYRYGPLEWLWRCLTYGRRFPLKR